MPIINMSEGGSGSGKRVTKYTVATSTNGWKKTDCDYLCDGVNDQEEINQAIQALSELGGEIVLLDGTYNISSAILLNKDKVSISGSGKSTKLLRLFDSSSKEGVITLSSTNGGCSVSSLYIDGNKGTYTNGNNVSVLINSSPLNKVKDVIVDNSSIAISAVSSDKVSILDNTINSANIGIELVTSKSSIVSHNKVYESEDTSIKLSTDSSFNNIINNVIIKGSGAIEDYSESQYSIYVEGENSANNLITNNMVMGKKVEDTSGNKTNTVVYNKWNNATDATGIVEYTSFEDLADMPGTLVTEEEQEDGSTGLVTWTTIISQNEVEIARRIQEEQPEVEGKAGWVTTTTIGDFNTTETSNETDTGWVTNVEGTGWDNSISMDTLSFEDLQDVPGTSITETSTVDESGLYTWETVLMKDGKEVARRVESQTLSDGVQGWNTVTTIGNNVVTEVMTKTDNGWTTVIS